MKKIFYMSAMLIVTMCAANGFAQNTMDSGNKMKMNGSKNADSKFMMTLATGGMNEIGLSNTALTKSSSDDVKEFAQKMVDDHTQAGDELKTLAESKSVTLPSAMDAKHQAENTKLQALSGSAFDMEYLKTMVKDHEMTVALLKKEAAAGKDAEAKALAQKLLPTVQGHLDMAQAMMSKMSSGKKMTGAAMKDGK